MRHVTVVDRHDKVSEDRGDRAKIFFLNPTEAGFFSESRRLRTRAPEIRESSRGLANPRAGVADLT